MRLLVKNIGKIVGIETAGRLRLCGGEMDRLETLDDAWLLADDGRIAAFGRMETLGEMAADRKGSILQRPPVFYQCLFFIAQGLPKICLTMVSPLSPNGYNRTVPRIHCNRAREGSG